MNKEKRDLFFIGGLLLFMIMFMFMMFGTASAGIYTTCSIDTGTDVDSVWKYIGDSYDGNDATWMISDHRANTKDCHYTIDSRTPRFAGIGVRYRTLDNPADNDYSFNITVEENDGGWRDLFDVELPDTGGSTEVVWQNISRTDPKLCDDEIRIEFNDINYRQRIVIYEIYWVWCDDGDPQFAYHSSCGKFSRPSGSERYGLYPEINGLLKDSGAGASDEITFQLWLYGPSNDTWWMADEEISATATCYNWEGKYWNRYNTQYKYALNMTDDFHYDCAGAGGNWYNTTYTFTIVPSPLDTKEDEQSLPYVPGLTDWDCWEMVSIPCWYNVSIQWQNFSLYNATSDKHYSWDYSVSNNTHYDGLWWFNSSADPPAYELFPTGDYMEPGKGYWIYFYDHNYSINHNITFPVEDETMSDEDNIISFTDFDGLGSDIDMDLSVWFNDTNPDTLEYSLSIDSYDLADPYVDETMSNLSQWVNYTDIDGLGSWINISRSGWFNDSDPDPGDTLELQSSILEYYFADPFVDESMLDLNNPVVFTDFDGLGSDITVEWDSWFNDTNPDTLETALKITDYDLADPYVDETMANLSQWINYTNYDGLGSWINISRSAWFNDSDPDPGDTLEIQSEILEFNNVDIDQDETIQDPDSKTLADIDGFGSYVTFDYISYFNDTNPDTVETGNWVVTDYDFYDPFVDETMVDLDNIIPFNNFDGLGSDIDMDLSVWFNDTNPDTLEYSLSIDSYDLVDPDNDESMLDLNNPVVFTDFDGLGSDITVEWDSWFNDTNPDTLETALKITDYDLADPDNDESMNFESWYNYSDFDGLGSWINISRESWFNDTNPDTLEHTSAILDYDLANGDPDETMSNLSKWVNYTDFDGSGSWINISRSAWFNDTNPDTLEISSAIISFSVIGDLLEDPGGWNWPSLVFVFGSIGFIGIGGYIIKKKKIFNF